VKFSVSVYCFTDFCHSECIWMTFFYFFLKGDENLISIIQPCIRTETLFLHYLMSSGAVIQVLLSSKTGALFLVSYAFILLFYTFNLSSMFFLSTFSLFIQLMKFPFLIIMRFKSFFSRDFPLIYVKKFRCLLPYKKITFQKLHGIV
jgi:hypothetical protein